VKVRLYFLLFLTLFLCFFLKESQACTTFNIVHGDRNVFGRNYDWGVGEALVVINKRGVSKTSLKIQRETGKPVTWTSKYGSVTFNQTGREFCQGGINEAGLVVATMALDETEFPAPDSRPYLHKLQWRQYLLDKFSTVEQVIASDARVRISKARAPNNHILVSDRTGDCAAIEFINGKMIVHTREALPVRALANNTYAVRAAFFEQHRRLPPGRGILRNAGCSDLGGC